MTVALADPPPASATAQPDSPHCPLCAMPAGPPAWRAAEGVQAAYGCSGCGFVYVWPRREQDFTETPADLYYHDFETLSFIWPDFLFTDISTAVRKRTSLSVEHGTTPHILDVGCGAGHSLLIFRGHGWEIEGIDPWKAVAAIGRKYYRLPIQDATLATARLEPGSKDIVLAHDVLQFVGDPKAFLETAFATLRPGGFAYMTVPNWASASARREGWDHDSFLPDSYLSYFTSETLRRLFEECGFTWIQIMVYGWPVPDDRLRVLASRPAPNALDWPDLAEEAPDDDLPPLDRVHAVPERLTADQEFWRENGYLILPGLIPDDINETYSAVRRALNLPGGWPHPTPYLDAPEIRDLCLYPPLVEMLEQLIGEPMGLHLNLTGWVSTERDWHQDDYLNPPEVNGHYIAAWTALDAIQPDAGPFEFVPGSHRWPIIRQRKVLDLLGHKDASDPYWPEHSERILTSFFEREIGRRGATVERFMGRRGDVLLWHARLLHRGSYPIRQGAERRSMIAHYSALSRRKDMPVAQRHPGGGWYFVPGAVPEPAPPILSEPVPAPTELVTPEPAQAAGPARRPWWQRFGLSR